MKRGYYSKVGKLFIILMLLIQIVSPTIAYGETIEIKTKNNLQLYQISEEIALKDNFTIQEGTLIYGKKLEDQIEIQYANTHITIPINSVKEVQINDTSPEFISEQLIAQGTNEILVHNTALYSLKPNETKRILINKDTQYPVSKAEEGIKVIYLGNVEFYQSSEDRLVVKDALSETEETEKSLVENNKPKEEINKDVETENSELVEDDNQQVKDSSNDESNVVDEENKTEESIVEEGLHSDNDTKKNIRNKRSSTFSSNNDIPLESKEYSWEGVSYFKVTSENLVVYTKGKTRKLGELKKGQVYPIDSDYGNWHQIQYGKSYGYVLKEGTIPNDGSVLKNQNETYKLTNQTFVSLHNIPVYDNSSGKLVEYGTIYEGEQYPIATDYGNWWRIIFTDRVGYVHKNDVQENFGGEGKYFRVLTEDLPVYDNRSGSLKKVGTLKKGQVYPRISDYGPNWHKIQYGNIYGYVESKYTEWASGAEINNLNTQYENQNRMFTALSNVPIYDNSTKGELIEFGEIKKGKTYPIVSDYGNWWRILFSGRVGYVNKDDVRSSFLSQDKYFKVVTDNLPIYDNRSGKLVKVGELTKGQVYPRISDYGPNWHKIQYGDIYGYVESKYTEQASSAEINNLNTQYKNQNRKITALTNVPVYDNTTKGRLAKFGEIKEGKAYPIVGDYGNWWRVILSDRVGYINKDDVKAHFLSGDKYFRVLTENLPVYDNRGEGLKKVGELRKGQTYPIASDYGNWWRVEFGDFYGYVYKADTEYGTRSQIPNLNLKYKHLNGVIVSNGNTVVYDNTTPGKLIPFGELENGTAYPVASDYGNWWRIIYLDRVGYVKKSEVTFGLSVNVPRLEVYSSFNDLAYYYRQDDIYTLSYGDTVEIIDEYRYAVKIKVHKNGIVGWVHKDKLDSNLSDNWWFVKETRNLRADATDDSSDIGDIIGGTSVRVLDYAYISNQTYRDWFKIQTKNGVTGWIWGGGSYGYNLSQYEKEYYNGTVNHINVFTPLNSTSTITAEQINRYISSKVDNSSYMYGMGEAFIDAQNETGINAIYLVSHAALETGYGTSSIVKEKFNYFGIGAFDACPAECANVFEGKRSGIINGAKWISQFYVNRDTYQQFTLYNMRYNNNIHQYATDEAWDVKIVDISRDMLNYLGY